MNPDVLIVDWFQNHRVPTLDALMSGVSYVTSWKVLLAAAAVTAFGLWRSRQRIEALTLFLGTAFGSLLEAILKRLFARPRPPIVSADSYSFPSGHALCSMVFFGLLAWWAGRADPKRLIFYRSLAAFIILLVGISRVYLGAHWPSDVMGGYFFGFCFLWFWLKVTQRPSQLLKR